MYAIINRARATTILVAALVAGCQSASGSAPGTSGSSGSNAAPHALEFTLVHNSANSGFTRLEELVIQDADEFTRRWRGVLQGSPDAEKPVVDFARTTVVFVALGSRNTGGYSVHIDSVTAQSAGATVHYTVTTPRARCMSIQVLTSPIEVIMLPRVEGVVKFRKRDVSGGC